ncbi:NepR family anti-sigma factor [Methylobacterium sp. J-077]|uniref:NepR family anti-sigma factor n=1 Tax=Methylobacterium sp. J-077 TaxID=2836656 RepID=UPI001FBBC67D|nr:NepR family anti-sigma factor [Methylobacterium sp. J-077]MCJ2122912.1 anti-sigma factor [Methylobacterium sp. J-077]
MADQGKDADLRTGDSHAGIAADRPARTARGASGDSPNTASAQGDRPATGSGLSDHTRNRLAAQLRAMYDTVAQQPVPDRFAELIAKLDSGDREKA